MNKFNKIVLPRTILKIVVERTWKSEWIRLLWIFTFRPTQFLFNWVSKKLTVETYRLILYNRLVFISHKKKENLNYCDSIALEQTKKTKVKHIFINQPKSQNRLFIAYSKHFSTRQTHGAKQIRLILYLQNQPVHWNKRDFLHSWKCKKGIYFYIYYCIASYCFERRGALWLCLLLEKVLLVSGWSTLFWSVSTGVFEFPDPAWCCPLVCTYNTTAVAF